MISSGRAAFAPKKHPLDVDPEQLVKGLRKPLLRKLGQRSVDVENPGIANKDVKTAKLADGFGDIALIVSKLGDVAGAGDHRVTEFGLQLFGSGRDTVQDPDACALLDEPRNDRTTDARTAARNQGHLPVEPTHG